MFLAQTLLFMQRTSVLLAMFIGGYRKTGERSILVLIHVSGLYFVMEANAIPSKATCHVLASCNMGKPLL